jgi:hypothetical protein
VGTAGPGDAEPGEERPAEDAREYARRLRSLPVDQVLGEFLFSLLNAAQVKLGRRDARLLIDVTTVVHQHARPHLPGELTTQIDQILGQLRMGQVSAESHTSQPEENDLGQAPVPPPANAGQLSGGLGRGCSSLGAAGAGHAQDDHQHDKQYGDDRWCDRAGPVEAWTRGKRDRQALPGQDGPEELTLLQGGPRVQRVRHGDDGEEGSADGCADKDPAGGGAIGSSPGGAGGGAIDGQVGEQDAQFFPGAGTQDVPGPLVELVGGDPADLEGLAQLRQRPVTFSVRYPHVAERKTPSVGVHGWRSFEAEARAHN